MRTYTYFLSSSALIQASTLIASSAQKIEYTTGYAVQAQYTGSAIEGVVSLKASNDGLTFVTIPQSTAYVNGSGSYMWNVISANYEYVMSTFLPSSACSSGFFSAILQSKGF